MISRSRFLEIAVKQKTHLGYSVSLSVDVAILFVWFMCATTECVLRDLLFPNDMMASAANLTAPPSWQTGEAS